MRVGQDVVYPPNHPCHRDLLMQATLNVTETIQDIHAWNAVIRSKRAPNPGALAKIGR
jgi:hypothetical protein